MQENSETENQITDQSAIAAAVPVLKSTRSKNGTRKLFTDTMHPYQIEQKIRMEVKDKELWGDMDISYSDMEILRDKLKWLLNTQDVILQTVCHIFPVLLTTYLVFLVRYKFDANFWGLLNEELDQDLDENTHKEIGDCVKRTFRTYGFDYSDTADDPWVNVSPILYEAGLPPESSLGDLFYVLSYDSYSFFDPRLVIDDLVNMRAYKVRKPMQRFLKRFQEDRAVDFLMEVHEAMVSVDYGRASDSRYIPSYTEWKAQEHSKETIKERKQQDYQTRPYLAFENGRKGLVMVLPRVIMQNEWTESARWTIDMGSGRSVSKSMNVFGDEGQRFVDSITVAVSPAKSYHVTLLDEEALDEAPVEWTVAGLKDGALLFNANGRLVSMKDLPSPYGVLISNAENGSRILLSDQTDISAQAYPTDREGYLIQTLMPTGDGAFVRLQNGSNVVTLHLRPQIQMTFHGETLFQLSPDDCQLFTRVPVLQIDIGAAQARGLELTIGTDRYLIDGSFKDGHAEIPLEGLMHDQNGFGYFEVGLYQDQRFCKLAGFNLVPDIQSTYQIPSQWPKSGKAARKTFRFERLADWEMTFDGCRVETSEDHYTIECPAAMGCVQAAIRSTTNDSARSCSFTLPVNPFTLQVVNENEDDEAAVEPGTSGMVRLTSDAMREENYWLRLQCYGNFRNASYQIQLRTANGIQQFAAVPLTQNSCANVNLAIFNDTLLSCPLPARIELCNAADCSQMIPVLQIHENMALSRRPIYGYKSGYLSISAEDKERDLIVQRFGKEPFSLSLTYGKSRLNGTGKLRGYKCPDGLLPGVYVVETSKNESIFADEEDETILPSRGNDTFLVSELIKDAPICSFTDWLDCLIKAVLVTDDIKAIQTMQVMELEKMAINFKGAILTEPDLEKLATLPYLIQHRTGKELRSAVERCMGLVSYHILTQENRLEMISILAALDSPPDIFEACVRDYCLFLFQTGNFNGDIHLPDYVENKSGELALMMRMGRNALIRNTISCEKYKDLIGREAIRDILTVPGTDDPNTIKLQRRQFALEKAPCNVHVELSKSLSGEMERIQKECIVTNCKHPYLDKTKVPDIGIYFDGIRFVDQYVNWYTAHHDRDGEIYPETDSLMKQLIRCHCKQIDQGIQMAKKQQDISAMTKAYEKALKGRYEEDPTQNVYANIYARFFYVEAMAAYLVKLPEGRKVQGWNSRPAEQFMSGAIQIAPRITRRDLMMATTYIYLVGKEEKICQ